MKVLVTGASGLLGRATLAQVKKDGNDVKGTALSRASGDLVKVNLTDFSALDELLTSFKPDAIIHTAAERRPDVVERNPQASHAINVDVPAHIAEHCKSLAAAGAKVPLLINISTDYVFDGTTPPYMVDDTPNPLNAYGLSKWDGEKGVNSHAQPGRATNFRVPVLYGRAESNAESAVNVLLDALSPESVSKPKKMDANAVRYPTNVEDVAKALSAVCQKFASGEESVPSTLHFSAKEAMTKYDMCLVMARCLRSVGEEAPTDHLEPEFEVDPSAATSRPRHCKLDVSVLDNLGISTECVSFESWWKEYLKEYAERAQEKRAKEAAEAEARRIAEEEAARKRAEEKEARRKAEEEATRKRLEEEAEQRRQEEEAAEETRREEEERQAEQQRQKQEEERKALEERREREEKEAKEREKKDGDKREQEGERESKLAEHEAPNDGSATEEEQRQGGGSTENGEEGGLAGASSTASASLRSPSSPHPSFSSLQARPTPPATSGRSSPTPSILSGQPFMLPQSSNEADSGANTTNAVDQLGTSEGTITAGAESSSSRGNGDDPLVPPPLSLDATVKQRRDTKPAKEEAPGFFPAALAKSADGSLLLDADTSRDRGEVLGEERGNNADADSDGYGQPSPRGDANSRPFGSFGAVGEENLDTEQAQAGGGEGGAQGTETDVETMRRSVSAQSSKVGSVEQKARPSFQIKVGDPQKVGDPVTAHIVYTVRTKTDHPSFKGPQFSALRRYNDFRWLHAALVHNNPGVFVPPVPEKVKIGRFAPDLVEARRHGLENCINKIANNDRLMNDEDLHLFLESDNFAADVRARDQIKGPVPTPEQKTYFGWSSSITNSHKFHEFDGWFEEQKVYLDHLESHLKNLVRVISSLAQQRKDLAGATSDLSHSLMMLSGSSLSRSLSTCFAGLGEVQKRSFELADVQADADVRDFGSVIYEYERVVGSARKAFATRVDAWQAWQRADEESRKVRAKHEKLKRDGNKVHPTRLQTSLEEIAVADSQSLTLKREFDLISIRCKEEMDLFERDKIQGLSLAIEVWVQGMIERQQELMAEWEQYAALLERQTGQKISAP